MGLLELVDLDSFLEIHFPPPEFIYVKFSSVPYTTMLELNFSYRIATMWNNLPFDIIEA